MRTRTDKVTHRGAHVAVELTLRETHALGTVLISADPRTGTERQAKRIGRDLLTVSLLVSPAQAEALAELAGRTAPRNTLSGAMALAIAHGLETAAQAARGASAEPGFGKWVDTECKGDPEATR